MSRILSLAGAGLVAALLSLAAPSAAQAQDYHRSGGYNQGYGSGYNRYTPGYQSQYGNDRYSPGYGSYSPGYGSGYGRSDRYDRPVIVHPQYQHYTPGRGYHDHGHLHVPHRGHYHTRPY